MGKGREKESAETAGSARGRTVDDETGRNGSTAEASAALDDSRRVYLVRHAERVDRIFPRWLVLGFPAPEEAEGEGKARAWTPYDLNLPLGLERRPGGFQQYAADPPVTEMGRLGAGLVGRGLGLLGHVWAGVYASPQLRCVQTAAVLCKAAGIRLPIKVEPGLWDSPAALPAHVFSAEELAAAGYPVSRDYAPVLGLEALRNRSKESGKETARRLGDVVEKLAERKPAQGALLLVGPAGMLDGGGRRLLGHPAAATDEDAGLRYPYLSALSLLFAPPPASRRWSLALDLPPLTHFDIDTKVRNPFLNLETAVLPAPPAPDKPKPTAKANK